MNAFLVLERSVGQAGANHATDVRVVQRLLNDWLGKNAQPQLKVDGLSGPKTIAAITLFQKKISSIADGRVDPQGPSIQALLNQHLANVFGMVDASRLSRYLNVSAIKNTSSSDPLISNLIQNYIKVLRMQA